MTLCSVKLINIHHTWLNSIISRHDSWIKERWKYFLFTFGFSEVNIHQHSYFFFNGTFIFSGPAIDLNISLNQDCSIKLTWKVPETKYKQSKYKIEYTYNDWKTTLELEKADINSYCRISHLAPYRTYHFHVTYFCMCDGVVIESISSDQKTIATSGKCLPSRFATHRFDLCTMLSVWLFLWCILKITLS